MMAIYGMSPAIDAAFRRSIVEDFHWMARPDALGVRRRRRVRPRRRCRVRVIHAPGHTRGHSLFHVEPDDVLYLGDIDLSSFGPYYGDAWSSLAERAPGPHALRLRVDPRGQRRAGAPRRASRGAPCPGDVVGRLLRVAAQRVLPGSDGRDRSAPGSRVARRRAALATGALAAPSGGKVGDLAAQHGGQGREAVALEH